MEQREDAVSRSGQHHDGDQDACGQAKFVLLRNRRDHRAAR